MADLTASRWVSGINTLSLYIFIASTISREFQIGSGRVDFLGVDSDDCIYCIELKNGPIGSSALNQVLEYVSDFKEMLEIGGSVNSVYGVLIGTRCDVATSLRLLDTIFYFQAEHSVNFHSYASTDSFKKKLKEQHENLEKSKLKNHLVNPEKLYKGVSNGK